MTLFLRAANGVILIPSLMLLVCLVQGSQVMNSYWYVPSLRSIQIMH